MNWDEAIGYDWYDISEYEDIQDSWKEGVHYDQNNKKYNIKNMETSHIINTIRYFKDRDTTPLKKELKRRGLSDVELD